eukprot:CCRYP_006203-RA/>CCRYP_006203-RA protein AED:0.03 eAED:0.03 QI:281/1/1/1/0.4/0.33/6/1869/435
MKSFILSTLAHFWISSPSFTSSFAPTSPWPLSPHTRPSHQTTAFATPASNQYSFPSIIVPQDLRLFLTQRCIQSFMFLLATTRDLHTVRWLDNFTKPVIVNNYWVEEEDAPNPGVEDSFREGDKRLGSKLLNYHGLSAINTTMYPSWDSFFTTLLEQPDTVLLIRTPSDVGQRAYSEFDIDIEPARLCSRILSVREQIARELVADLKVISTMGQQIFDSYWYNVKKREDSNPAKSSGGRGGIGWKDGSSPSGFDRPSLLYMNFDPLIDSDFAPSPLRKGNFDLLYNLITQKAVTELLRAGVFVGENDVQNEACLRYLDKFYRERVLTHFVGAQFYGKGDDFIEELMLAPPMIMFDDLDDEKGDFGEDSEEEESSRLQIEPLRIAEQILLKRDKLALEWLEICSAVPSEHMDIRKLQLSRMMGQQNDKAAVTDDFQ